MPKKGRSSEPLQYNIFPSPNTDHSRFLTAYDFITACWMSPGGESVRVTSTDVESFRYDPQAQALTVVFVNKKNTAKRKSPVVRYQPVDIRLAELFFNASSKGQFVHLIRDRFARIPFTYL